MKYEEDNGHFKKDAPSEIAGVKVTETRDYLEDKIVDVATGKVSPTNLPKSNVLYFTLADDTCSV